MKLSFSITFAVLLHLPPLAWGKVYLTLQEALKRASDHNLSLKAARSELKIFDGNVIQAGAISNPEIEGGIAEIPFGGSDEPLPKEIGIQQTIQLGGKRSLKRESARSELEAARAQYRVLELEIFRQVKETYWELSLTKYRVNFARENLQFQQRFLARVQDRFQSGQTKSADIARAKLEVARVSNDLLVTRKNLKSAQSSLNRLMGRDIRQTPPDPEHLQETVLKLHEDSLIRKALLERPERKAIVLLMKGAKADIRLAQRLLWAPDMTAGFLYQTGERDNSWGAHLGLSFPLWYRYRGERLSASARKVTLEAQLEDLDQAITLEVHQAFLEVQLSAEQIKLWKQAVDQATEASRLAEQKYLEGDADLMVFLQTRRDLVNATLDYLEALRNYQVNLAALERAVGKDFSGGDIK